MICMAKTNFYVEIFIKSGGPWPPVGMPMSCTPNFKWDHYALNKKKINLRTLLTIAIASCVASNLLPDI